MQTYSGSNIYGSHKFETAKGEHSQSGRSISIKSKFYQIFLLNDERQLERK